MLQPIQKDHELMCPGCGAVLQNLEQSPEIKYSIPVSINVNLLGSALVKSNKYKTNNSHSPSEFYEEKTLRRLVDITKKFDIPERFAQDTFNELKRRNRGFRSEKEPIKQLIKILSKDENYFFMKKLRLLKTEYENIINN